MNRQDQGTPCERIASRMTVAHMNLVTRKFRHLPGRPWGAIIEHYGILKPTSSLALQLLQQLAPLTLGVLQRGAHSGQLIVLWRPDDSCDVGRVEQSGP